MRTNTIEELDKEYRRLLNFSDNVESCGFILDDDFENNNIMSKGDNWLCDKEERGISWYDF